jgi:hypothetical protein
MIETSTESPVQLYAINVLSTFRSDGEVIVTGVEAVHPFASVIKTE